MANFSCALYENVVYVYFYILLDLLCEHLVHKSLVSYPYIL